MCLDWNAVIWAAGPDLQIIVWTVAPGTPTHDYPRVPASWAADRTATVGDIAGRGRHF